MKTIKWIVLCYCVSAFQYCFAQNKKSDSLKVVLKQQKTRDTTYVNLLYKIAANLTQENNLNSAKQFTKAGIELAKVIKWDIGTANGLFTLADLLNNEEKYDSSASICYFALNTAEKIQNRRLIANTYHLLGYNYNSMGNDSLAEYYYLKFLDAAKVAKNDKMIFRALFFLTDFYLNRNQLIKSQGFLDKASAMAIANDNAKRQAALFELQATIQFKKKNFKSALDYEKQSLSMYANEKEKNYHIIAYSIAQVSYYYCGLKNKDSASYYAYAALAMAKQKDLKKEITDAYKAVFNYHRTFGEYKKALEYRLVYDSLYNAAYNSGGSQNSERTRIRLEQEKKDLIAQREQEIKESNATKSRNLQLSIIGGFMLLAGFLFWNNQQKQKANIVLQEQKDKVESTLKELKTTQTQLIQKEKLASLGELTAGIAHEIQNPLNFVNNFSEVSVEMIDEVLEERQKEEGERDESLINELLSDLLQNQTKINHHGKRASNIVKGMLEHSRTSTGERVLTDINQLADEYLRLSYHGLRAKNSSFNADFKTDFDPNLPKILVVPQEIGRVLLNLINNAFYAVSQRPNLTCLQDLSGLNTYQPTVTVTTKNLENTIEISVKDNGSGIPEIIKSKIFQPFFTTKPTGEGTGLGLSLSYDIVTKGHGGTLEVVSVEGEGSEFIVKLPIRNT